MSEAFIYKTTIANPSTNRSALRKSPYVATAAEAMKNYATIEQELCIRRWTGWSSWHGVVSAELSRVESVRSDSWRTRRVAHSMPVQADMNN